MTNMPVTWNDINDFPNYEVSNIGDIRNKKTKLVLNHNINDHGYHRVMLYKDGPKRVSVHRIVAKTFIDNPKSLPQINHINGNKSDNRVENLEWCDAFYNQQHRRNILKLGNRSVRCIETGKEFGSIKEAADALNSHVPDIVRACKNGSTAKGYHWEYI